MVSPAKSQKYEELLYDSVDRINAGIIKGSVNIGDKILIFNPKVIEELNNRIGVIKQINVMPTRVRYGIEAELISKIIQTKGNAAMIAMA